MNYNAKLYGVYDKVGNRFYTVGLADTEITLKDDEYFVLGDNRNNSEDSRYQTIGNISKANIIGKVWLNVSFDNFGLVQ